MVTGTGNATSAAGATRRPRGSKLRAHGTQPRPATRPGHHDLPLNDPSRPSRPAPAIPTHPYQASPSPTTTPLPSRPHPFVSRCWRRKRAAAPHSGTEGAELLPYGGGFGARREPGRKSGRPQQRPQGGQPVEVRGAGQSAPPPSDPGRPRSQRPSPLSPRAGRGAALRPTATSLCSAAGSRRGCCGWGERTWPSCTPCSGARRRPLAASPAPPAAPCRPPDRQTSPSGPSRAPGRLGGAGPASASISRAARMPASEPLLPEDACGPSGARTPPRIGLASLWAVPRQKGVNCGALLLQPPPLRPGLGRKARAGILPGAARRGGAARQSLRGGKMKVRSACVQPSST